MTLAECFVKEAEDAYKQGVRKMNLYCKKDCKHKSYCKLDEKQTETCKVASLEDNLICGMTFKEIKKLQQRK